MAEDSDRPLGPTAPPQPPADRQFATIPNRPPLREIARGIENVAQKMQARAIELRTQARLDAANAVSRARERAGFPATQWTGAEADILHAITDLLLQIQQQDRGGARAPEQPEGA